MLWAGAALTLGVLGAHDPLAASGGIISTLGESRDEKAPRGQNHPERRLASVRSCWLKGRHRLELGLMPKPGKGEHLVPKCQ